MVGKPEGNKKVRRHKQRWNIAHETATFPNLPMRNFTGDEKNTTDPQQTKTEACYIFTEIKTTAASLWRPIVRYKVCL